MVRFRAFSSAMAVAVLAASCSPAKVVPLAPAPSGGPPPSATVACASGSASSDAGRGLAPGCVSVADGGIGIVSSCQDAVKERKGVRVLGGPGDCFFAVTPAPTAMDYTLELDTRLVDGPGFGIWLRGSYVSGSVVGLGIQFDPGAGGLKLVHYPDEGTAVRFLDHACDKNWHHWKLIGTSGTTRILLDGVQVFDFSGGGVTGPQFGFRTWGGSFEVRKIAVGDRDGAQGQR